MCQVFFQKASVKNYNRSGKLIQMRKVIAKLQYSLGILFYKIRITGYKQMKLNSNLLE